MHENPLNLTSVAATHADITVLEIHKLTGKLFWG